jgi:aquaporin Z
MEGAGLALFMVSACLLALLLEHPASPLRQALDSTLLRRALMGIGMGTTAIALIYSPWGRQSGAHLNPAVTLTFLRLGKIAGPDAAFYIAAQFAGGLLGVLAVAALWGRALAHPSVNHVATTPGRAGAVVAFVAEVLISFGMMLLVLNASNRPPISHLTGLFAGALIALYITFEAPLSGMSMNPARTLSSALPARTWNSLWIYFAAPTLGMMLASLAYQQAAGAHEVLCAKLVHTNGKRCIFVRCGFHAE